MFSQDHHEKLGRVLWTDPHLPVIDFSHRLRHVEDAIYPGSHRGSINEGKNEEIKK